ncbi:uncharacterized protein LOC143020871 [Oratosquilla oratoria]|uniref:uncharacterized protein LOC143020871 n=1 Tax=Oratosquilla oratoria TaxID=337810 RepID=UPI003F758500
MGNNHSGSAAHPPPPTWTQSFPREAGRRHPRYGAISPSDPTKQPKFFHVLPEPAPGQKLRPTENGRNLQAQGTISARKFNELQVAAAAPHKPIPVPSSSSPFPVPLTGPHPHSASLSALHGPSCSGGGLPGPFYPDASRAASVHDLRFVQPPSKSYASEPDLRNAGPLMPGSPISPMPHTIISQSPTKGRIKSKKKYKAPSPPSDNSRLQAFNPLKGPRSRSLSDSSQDASPPPHGQDLLPWAPWHGNPPQSPVEEPSKPKTRKMGLFKKKNESKKSSKKEEKVTRKESERRGASEERRDVVVREELRERARSVDCLHHELSQRLAATPTSSSMVNLEIRQQTTRETWGASLERPGYRPAPLERDARRSSSSKLEVTRRVQERRHSSTLEREPRSHRRMSTLERRAEEKKLSTIEREARASTPSSSGRPSSRLDSYRESSSHRRSSSSGSRHNLIPEEENVGSAPVVDEWDTAEADINQRRKLSENLQQELKRTAMNLRKTSVERGDKKRQSSTSLTHSSNDEEKRPSRPSSRGVLVAEEKADIPKTFYFGMIPEKGQEAKKASASAIQKIKTQEDEKVRISGESVEFSRRTLEKKRERSKSRDTDRDTRSPAQEEPPKPSKTSQDDSKALRRKLSKDVEEFAVAIEKRKSNRRATEEVLGGSSFRREDGGYHSRQNSGSFHLEESAGSDEEMSITMNLRPMLPRRQHEIPRFSPNAAWRSLSVERHHAHREAHNASRSSDDPEPVEDKIQRMTRPSAPLRAFGEKSADSGISGDAGSPGATHEFESVAHLEKSKASSGPLAMSSPLASGRQDGRRAWTPAQDLDDTSMDGSGEQGGVPVPKGLTTPPKLTSRSNMFPQSPARERAADCVDGPIDEPPVDYPTPTPPQSSKDLWSRRKKKSGDPPPQKFNSLRKLKRSMSGALTVIGRKSPDDKRSHSPEDRKTSDTWRDNWSLSRSIPNSLNTCDAHESTSNLSGRERSKSGGRSPAPMVLEAPVAYEAKSDTGLSTHSRPRTPSYLNYGSSGHIMYLPEYNSRKPSRTDLASEDEDDERRGWPMHGYDHGVRPLTPDQERKPPSGDEGPSHPENYDSYEPGALPGHLALVSPQEQTHFSKSKKSKKFTYQSTVRMLEKRKIEEKLSKEVAEKEKQRLKEMETMRKVEEEFQRKREREKKKVKEQLKLLSLQQQQHLHGKTLAEVHNTSYSSDETPVSSSSSDRPPSDHREVSSQDSERIPPLPAIPPPSLPPSHSYYSTSAPTFHSLPPELIHGSGTLLQETPPEGQGIFSGFKSWVKGRRSSGRGGDTRGGHPSSAPSGMTSAPRQEPDGAPASSPSSSPRKSSDSSDFRAEVIAASKSRSGNMSKEAQGSPPPPAPPQQGKRSIYKHLTEVASREEKRHADLARRSRSPEAQRHPLKYEVHQPELHHLTHELPELRQERREYREYRSPTRHQAGDAHCHGASGSDGGAGGGGGGGMGPAAVPVSQNYRREFSRGNAQVIGPNVISVRMKGREDHEASKGNRHRGYSPTPDDRRSVSSCGGSSRGVGCGSGASSNGSRHSGEQLQQQQQHPGRNQPDFVEDHRTGRTSGVGSAGRPSSSCEMGRLGPEDLQHNGSGEVALSKNFALQAYGSPPGAVDSSPARFAHSMLTPFQPGKGYRPVSFSPPPPTKILHVK